MTERHEQLITLYLQVPFAMTEQQRQELSAWIAQDVENTREFIKASLFHWSIHDVLLDSDEERKQILHTDMGVPDTSTQTFDKQLWNMLLKEEQTAPKIEIEKSQPKQELIQSVKYEKNLHRTNKTSLLTVITSIAALILLLLYVRFVPNTIRVEVATLKNTVNVQWAESASPTSPNGRLTTNHKPLMLRQGYAELVFDNNARVVLEAPVEFQVLSYDQIKLTYGRLYATVPKEALGFIVSTPTSKIIDLGTEFGVQADFNGTTELHVIKGKTSLVAGLNDNKINILLNAGSARKIIESAPSPVEIPYNKQMFARQINSKTHFVWRGQNVSLADIVGGGNGFGTGKLDQGIEPLTGDMTQSLSRKDVYPGPKGYVRVPSIPYIDGVFVPGMDLNATQITSTGIQTGEFPENSGQIWGYVFNGAWHEGSDVPRHCLQLAGVPLEGTQNPAITMHSNLGITFDLSAMREKLPGVRIKSFSSAFGISQTVEKWIKFDFVNWQRTANVEKLAVERHSTAEFWVFLDGKKVLRQKLSSISQSGTIDIPIDDNVRFLTLAVTEADDTFMYDWGVFVRPELGLESAEQPLLR